MDEFCTMKWRRKLGGQSRVLWLDYDLHVSQFFKCSPMPISGGSFKRWLVLPSEGNGVVLHKG
jgi:hypothetical protein